MTQFVSKEKQYMAYRLYAAKVGELMGLINTRAVYQKGLSQLKDEDRVNFGLSFAKMEQQIKEIDRARKIYAYLSQFCEPGIEEHGFWDVS